MNETDFAQIAFLAKEQAYLSNASVREKIWYQREKKLIADKFDNSIEPLPIVIFRRRNASIIGTCGSDKIRLHNKRGCTRSTLIHELVHAWLAKYKGYIRSHPQEFWELYRYLMNGGKVQGFYERIENKQIRVAAHKIEKKSPHYKLQNIEQKLKAWRTKQKRAATAIKKLERQKKRLGRVLNEFEQEGIKY